MHTTKLLTVVATLAVTVYAIPVSTASTITPTAATSVSPSASIISIWYTSVRPTITSNYQASLPSLSEKSVTPTASSVNAAANVNAPPSMPYFLTAFVGTPGDSGLTCSGCHGESGIRPLKSDPTNSPLNARDMKPSTASATAYPSTVTTIVSRIYTITASSSSRAVSFIRPTALPSLAPLTTAVEVDPLPPVLHTCIPDGTCTLAEAAHSLDRRNLVDKITGGIRCALTSMPWHWKSCTNNAEMEKEMYREQLKQFKTNTELNIEILRQKWLDGQDMSKYEGQYVPGHGIMHFPPIDKIQKRTGSCGAGSPSSCFVDSNIVSTGEEDPGMTAIEHETYHLDDGMEDF